MRLIDDVVLAEGQRKADDRALVTAGRAAQMLRMDRRHVRLYAHAGELRGDWVETPKQRKGERLMQLVFTKGEVRRFRQLLEDRQRRRPTRREQIDLPLVSAQRARPQSWRWAAFTPRMLKARIGADGSQVGSSTRAIAERKRRVG
jgi:hypothetical protein